jgi:hypothetical protein
MLRIKLSKIETYLMRMEPENPAAAEIWNVIKYNCHPRSEIMAKFSPETTETIKRIDKLLKDQETQHLKELELIKKRKRRKK